MTRTELEHIIRAVAAITNEKELIVIGSQAILGQYPDAPKKLLVSDEADIYAPRRPELSDLIDGALGELSQFEATFGYRAETINRFRGGGHQFQAALPDIVRIPRPLTYRLG